MAGIILHHVSLPVYWDSLLEWNIGLLVIFLSEVLRIMRCQFISPNHHPKKLTIAKRYIKIIMYTASFIVFFCFDDPGDIFSMLVPYEWYRFPRNRTLWGKHVDGNM